MNDYYGTWDATVDYINLHYTWSQPGWTMRALKSHEGPGRPVLFFEAMVRDTYDPTNPRLNRVGHSHPIPPFPPGETRAIDHFVRTAIHRVVQHEADEWLRKDGVMIFNPHADDLR